MQNTIEYKGVKVNFLDIGKGEVTLFLHGWEGSIESFLFVARQINYRKILIDLPPFGESEKLKEPWTLYDYVGLVKCIMKKLGVKKYNIVAHSFGGRIALLLGASDSVNKMVLTGCAGIKDKSMKTKCKIYKYKFLKLCAKLRIVNKNALANYGSKDYIKLNNVLKQTFKNIVNLDLKNMLKNVKAQTLLIWGEKDYSTKLKHGKLMNKKIKNSGLYVIKNGSHFAYIERADIFISSIKLFLKV